MAIMVSVGYHRPPRVAWLLCTIGSFVRRPRMILLGVVIVVVVVGLCLSKFGGCCSSRRGGCAVLLQVCWRGDTPGPPDSSAACLGCSHCCCVLVCSLAGGHPRTPKFCAERIILLWLLALLLRV